MSKKPTMAQLQAELAEIEAQYHIPASAFTFQELRKQYPSVPESRLRELIQRRVASGEMKKGRRGPTTYYWPA